MPAANDRLILDKLLEQRGALRAPHLSKSEFFELFVVEELLRDRELSSEELLDGLVDGGGDGGLDAIYIFENGTLLLGSDSEAQESFSPRLEALIVQAKLSAGFSAAAVDKMRESIADLLDMSVDLSDCAEVYNAQVLEKFAILRSRYTHLAAKFPELYIRIAYASKGQEVHPNVRRKAARLDQVVRSLFSDCRVDFEFVTASRLVELARRQEPAVLRIRLSDVFITEDSGAVGLARLRDYYQFLVDPVTNTIHPSIFEDNVRDFEGDTLVNESIQKSLAISTEEDFWWLNNGVTIVASGVSLAGRTLTLMRPRIVNGLQTSVEIYRHFRESPSRDDERSLLVRVVSPKDESSRDRIIVATNNQNPMPRSALRATDPLQRDIEQYLGQHGICYERRRNQYSNQDVPIDAVLSMAALGECILGAVLHTPNLSKPRVSAKFLRSDTIYGRIFSPDYPLDMYHQAALLMLRVLSWARSAQGNERLARLRLSSTIAMVLSIARTRSVEVSPSRFSEQDFKVIPLTELEGAYRMARSLIPISYRRPQPQPKSVTLDRLRKLARRGAHLAEPQPDAMADTTSFQQP